MGSWPIVYFLWSSDFSFFISGLQFLIFHMWFSNCQCFKTLLWMDIQPNLLSIGVVLLFESFTVTEKTRKSRTNSWQLWQEEKTAQGSAGSRIMFQWNIYLNKISFFKNLNAVVNAKLTILFKVMYLCWARNSDGVNNYKIIVNIWTMCDGSSAFCMNFLLSSWQRNCERHSYYFSLIYKVSEAERF